MYLSFTLNQKVGGVLNNKSDVLAAALEKQVVKHITEDGMLVWLVTIYTGLMNNIDEKDCRLKGLLTMISPG